MSNNTAIYLRCPACAVPCMTRLGYVEHQRTHGVDMEHSSVIHGVAPTDDGRWFSIAEDTYSDSTCLFTSDWEAQKQDDRTHAHLLRTGQWQH